SSRHSPSNRVNGETRTTELNGENFCGSASSANGENSTFVRNTLRSPGCSAPPKEGSKYRFCSSVQETNSRELPGCAPAASSRFVNPYSSSRVLLKISVLSKRMI